MTLGIGIAKANAALLGVGGRGELAIYIVFGTLLGLAASGGVEMAGAYYAGTKKHSLTKVVTGEIFIFTASTAIAFLTVFVLLNYPPKFMYKFTYLGLLFGLGYVPGLLAQQSFWYLHAALGHTLIYNLGTILNAGFTLAGIVLFCWNNGKPEYAMLSYVTGSLLSAGFMLAALMVKHKIRRLHFSWQCIKDIYIYGIKYYFARLSQFLNVQIGTMIIAFIGNKDEVGYFSSSMGMVCRLFILQEVLCTVLLSRIIKAQEQSIALAAKTYRTVFWLLLGGSAVLAIFCKPLIRLLLTAEFLPIAVPVLILLPGVILRCCTKVLNVYNNGIGKPGINSVGIVFAVITNAALMYFLLPIWSIRGAALAATLGYLVDAVILISYYRLMQKHSLSWLIPRIKDLTYLIMQVYNRINPGRKTNNESG